MKKLLVIMALVGMVRFVVNAQFSNIDTTTVHAVPTWSSGSFIHIAGVTGSTNAAYTTTNPAASTTGDSLALTQAKMNYNFTWLTTWLATNSPYAGFTNFWLNGDIDGLSGANLFSAQGATDIRAIVDADLQTNSIIMYGTNGAGGGGTSNAVPIYNGGATNLTVTNTLTVFNSTPYYTIGIYNPTNFPPNTNYACTNMNGPYYPATNIGIGAMTNACGYVAFLLPIPPYTNVAPQLILLTNGFAGNGYYYESDPTGTLFTNLVAGTTYWASYGTPDIWHTNIIGWGLYFATNVVFTNYVPFITGASYLQYVVTNAGVAPSNNFPYVPSSSFLGPPYVYFFGSMPYTSPITSYRFPPTWILPPNLTNTAPVIYPPSTNPPPGITNIVPPWVPPGPPEILFTVGTQEKMLSDGMAMWSAVNQLNQALGIKTSSLTISPNGTATEVLLGVTVRTIPWSNPDWTTSIPAGAWNTLGIYPLPIGGGGVTVY